MKNITKLCFLGLFILVPAAQVLCQTDAAEWFQLGLDSPTPDAKIRAFEKVVQLDPNYVEAYYYLGLAYKQKNMLAEAEIALDKAYYKNPYALNNDIKTRILFELGHIYSGLGKPEKSKEAFINAKELTTNKRIKGRIQYELGQIYLAEGLVHFALRELREGKTLWPESAKEFDSAIAFAENQKNLQTKYNQALQAVNSGLYRQAMTLLDEILRIDPDFKETQKKRNEAQNALNRDLRISSLYTQALQAQNRGRTREAIRLYEQILAIEPAYRDVNTKLRRLQRRLKTPKTKPEIKSPAGQPVSNGTSSLARHNADKKVRPHAVDSPELLENTETNGRSRGYDNIIEIDSLYQHGIFFLQNGDWRQAVSTFEKVKRLDASYKDVENKLADANFNLSKHKNNDVNQSESESSGSFFFIASALSALALPIVGFFLISPATRARLYLLQGNSLKAAKLYEKMLLKNPGKIKYYPLLAHIYLQENRRDSAALKVYETILKLNIYTKRKGEINTIMANHYLTQGSTNASAIRTLEQELNSKIKKLKSA